MSEVGSHNGIQWIRARYCDVAPAFHWRERWYFLLDEKRKPTGDCFRTKREMETWLDAERERRGPWPTA